MSKRFVVVYEAVADFATATELADRILCEQIDWIDEAALQYCREWVGQWNGADLTWIALAAIARERRFNVRGKFNNEPGAADAPAARRAILYLQEKIPTADAIVLIRDADNQIERRQGLEQAKAWFKDACPIVAGLAICERECWVISGFEPNDARETRRLEDERQTLGFWPHEHSHRLTSCADDNAIKSPKRVLHALTGGNVARERSCWIVTSLQSLRERGQHNGLAAYLDDVRASLIPILTA